MITAGFEKPGGYEKLLFEPGAQWHYSDGGPNWLAECLTLAYGRDLNEVIFERGSEFSRSAMEFAEQIERESWSLLDEESERLLPRGIQDINRLFCISDWLAIHFQKKTLRVLRATHVLAFLMGCSFILWSDYETWPFYMFAFLLFFLLAYALGNVAAFGVVVELRGRCDACAS